jgi:hypothetical protein
LSAPPPTAPAPTTTTTPPPTTAAVYIINHAAESVLVTINGQAHTVASQTASATFQVTPAANNNDVVEVHSVPKPSCGEGDATKYFTAGLTYEVQVKDGAACLGSPGPVFTVVQTLSHTG